METRRWINHSLPQTLANAVILLYLNAAIDFLFRGFAPIWLLLAVGQVTAGYLIANEKKAGWQLGVGCAVAPFALRFLIGGVGGILAVDIFSLAFEIILLVLLLHEQSREHQRIWFD